MMPPVMKGKPSVITNRDAGATGAAAGEAHTLFRTPGAVGGATVIPRCGGPSKNDEDTKKNRSDCIFMPSDDSFTSLQERETQFVKFDIEPSLQATNASQK